MNKRKTIKLLFLLMIALFICAGYFFYSSSSSIGERSVSPMKISLEKGTHMSIKGFSFIDQDFDKIRMSVKAEEVNLCDIKYHYFRIATVQVLEMVRPAFKLYGDDGKSTEIVGESAVINPLRKEVVFQDGAEIKNARGIVLRSRIVIWNYKKGFIQAKGGYSLSAPGNTKNGDNICINLQDMTFFN